MDAVGNSAERSRCERYGAAVLWFVPWIALLVLIVGAVFIVVLMVSGASMLWFNKRPRNANGAARLAGPLPDPSQRGTVSLEASAVFAALDTAQPVIVEALAEHGVTRVEYVVGFVYPYSVSVWLGTQGDVQRDALPSFLLLRDQVAQILVESGLPMIHVCGVRVTAQSEQTVQREYGGNWFYALR